MYYRKFLRVPHPSHTHMLAVEWYSSHLDEILTVSEPSPLTRSASPPPLQSPSSIPAVPLYQHSVILTDVSVTWDKKWGRGDRWYPLWRHNFKMALDRMNGSQPQAVKWKQLKTFSVELSFLGPNLSNDSRSLFHGDVSFLKKGTFHAVQTFRHNISQFLRRACFACPLFTFFSLWHVHICQKAMKKVLGKTFIQKYSKAEWWRLLLVESRFSKVTFCWTFSIKKIKNCPSTVLPNGSDLNGSSIVL